MRERERERERKKEREREGGGKQLHTKFPKKFLHSIQFF